MGKQLVLKEEKSARTPQPQTATLFPSLLHCRIRSLQSNWRATLPSPILPLSLSSPPLEVGPFNTARRSVEHCLLSWVWGGITAEIELGAFSHGGTKFTNFPECVWIFLLAWDALDHEVAGRPPTL